MSGEPKDKLAQIADVISKMIGRPYPPYSLLGTPMAFFGPSRRFEKKGDAVSAKKKAEAIIVKTKALEIALDELPDEQAQSIFHSAFGLLEIDFSIPEDTTTFNLHTLLRALKAGAEKEIEGIDYEIENCWNIEKRQPKVHENEVANAIAEIYIRERSEYPEFKKSNKLPSSDYCKAVADIFTILGLKTGFSSPSERVAKEIRGKIDLETAKRELKQRTAMQQAMGFAFSKLEAGLVPKSLISNATAKPRSD